MASDIAYDGFDYNSIQDYCEIDYQIDLFELRQYSKSKKQIKILKSQPTSVKMNCMSYKKKSKAEQKSFRYNRYPSKPKLFECDEEFHTKSTSTQSNVPSTSSKKLQDKHLENFSNFRRHFYHVNHQHIKSSFKENSNIEVTDIRLAPIDESVQDDFMKRLNEDSAYFPQLVYHGTQLNNIESILRYGFLIPNQVHPTNSEAPIIVSRHGRQYGTGIYCSRTAIYSLSYITTTNTLLACAAIPKRDKVGKIQLSYGSILVLSHVSQIIPLFLVDFKYLNKSGINNPWFNVQKELKMDENKEIEKSVVISRKYLRKILNFTNDQERKNNQYQVRMFDPIY